MATLDVRRAVAVRASTVYERVQWFEHSHAHEAPSADPASHPVLSAWERAFAPGADETVARRLSWDGLTAAVVAASVEADIEPTEPPTWIAWLPKIGAAARILAAELRVGPIAELAYHDEREPPYVEVWLAIVRAARPVVADRLGGIVDRLITPNAHAAIEDQLMRELALCGDLAVDTLYQAHLDACGVPRANSSHDTSHYYDGFVRGLLDGELAELWTTYPVLARQVATVVHCWVDATVEMLLRLSGDRSAIASTFGDGADPGPVEHIESGLSDPHDGRRRVVIFRFGSGLAVVYKPRSLAIDRAFEQLVRWIVDAGFRPPLVAMRIITKEGYGWVEFANHQPLATRESVACYFEQAGALLCLAGALGSRDLHMENVVATPAGPVLIDLELLLQPLRASKHGESDAGDAVDPRAFLRSGLLCLNYFGVDDEVIEQGGLRGDGRTPLGVPRRVWRDLRSDAVHRVEEKIGRATLRNGVVLDGVLQLPEMYAQEIRSGFRRMGRLLIDCRRELLAPNGPLDAFRATAVRVLARPTDQYAMLGAVRNTPRYQGDGASHSVAADVLNRAFRGAQGRPLEWPIIVEERRVMDALDVPRFVVPGDGRTVYSAGRPVLPDYYARSPIEAVRDRIERMTIENCERQELALAATLATNSSSRYIVGFDRDASAHASPFVAHAEWIARELLARASECGDDLCWDACGDRQRADAHWLYGGSLGPAVFFSALAVATGDDAWRRHAERALAPALAWLESGANSTSGAVAIGACNGLGSVVYGLTMCGSLLGWERPVAMARRAAALITASNIAADRSFDIVDGAAGAVVSLLGLHAVTGDKALIETAARCGDHLVDFHLADPSGWVWPSADGRRLIGMAHGSAGVGMALSQLSRVTGDRRYRDAALQAFAFVSRWYEPCDAVWPVAAIEDDWLETVVLSRNAWCHGAPGIMIAATEMLDIAPEATILGQVRRAFSAAGRWAVNQPDQLCCGHLGRADALAIAGDRAGVPEARAMALDIAERVMARANRIGHFRVSTPGFGYHVFDPGLFQGISGIGYQLLRFAAPERLPSILAFEVPFDRRG